MKKVRNIIQIIKLFAFTHKKVSIAVLIAIILIGFFLRPQTRTKLETIEVKKGNLTQSITVNGSIVAKRSVDLTFPVGGKLVYLGVAKGDTVAQWQTIATLDSRTAQKNLEAALINYSLQRNTFDQTKENNQNRTPKEALNDQAKRILENNQYDLNKTINSVELQALAQEQSVLTTPISGIVTRADAKVSGVNVTTSTTFTVVDPNSLVFNLDVDEADISKVTHDKKVRVTLDAYSDKPFDTDIKSIDFVSHTTSTGGNAYTVEVSLEGVSLPYRVGMNGNAEIILQERSGVVFVPITSVIDNKYIFVQTKNGFEKREIKEGMQTDTDVEVIKGVFSHDLVVLQPHLVPQESKNKLPSSSSK